MLGKLTPASDSVRSTGGHMEVSEENVRLVRAFLEFKQREGKSRRTLHSYRIKLVSLLHAAGPVPLGALTPEDLERWLDRERPKRTPSGRAALGTVKNEAAILRSAFKFWRVRGMVAADTAAM